MRLHRVFKAEGLYRYHSSNSAWLDGMAHHVHVPKNKGDTVFDEGPLIFLTASSATSLWGVCPAPLIHASFWGVLFRGRETTGEFGKSFRQWYQYQF